MIITTPEDQKSFISLLGDGSRFGAKFHYVIQKSPKGLAEAFILDEKFIQNDDVCLVLGDNLFYGDFSCFRQTIEDQKNKKEGKHAHIFAYTVQDPERYGVIETDRKTGKILSIEEKPKTPKSKMAIPGLYLFDKTVSTRAKNLKPSPRGELEITDLMKTYLHEGTLGLSQINRGMAWFDTGTPQSLLEASSFIAAIEQRQGHKVACLEEIALLTGALTLGEFKQRIEETPKGLYRQYLETVLSEHVELS